MIPVKRENYKPMMVCVDWDGPQMQMGTDHQQLNDLHDDQKYLETEKMNECMTEQRSSEFFCHQWLISEEEQKVRNPTASNSL